MSETKFTPGNWKVHCGYLVRSCIGDECAPICDLQSPYRRFYGIVRASNEGWHNAHLIAAAPDMYAALKDLLGIIHKIPTCSDKDCIVCPTEAGFVARARAALAKAEGKGV